MGKFKSDIKSCWTKYNHTNRATVDQTMKIPFVICKSFSLVIWDIKKIKRSSVFGLAQGEEREKTGF